MKRDAIGSGTAALCAAAVIMLLLTAMLCRAPAGGGTPELRPAADTFGGALDLNEATAEELCGLPGVGESLARSIIDRREESGGFHSREDILAVPGIGEARYEAILPYITY